MEQSVSYLREKGIKFPYNIKISKETMEFLAGVLQVDEVNRLEWNQVNIIKYLIL